MFGENYGHPIVGFAGWEFGGLGDIPGDNQLLLGLGFNSLQIQQIMSAHASGALSDAGYNALVSGFVSPNQLVGFLEQDPGAPAGPPALPPTSVPQPPPGQLPPGPAPRVSAYPTGAGPGQWFSSSSMIQGLPNWAVLAGALLGLPLVINLISGSGGRRR